MSSAQRPRGTPAAGGYPPARTPAEPRSPSVRGGEMPGPIVHVGYHKTGTSWLQRHLFRTENRGFARLLLSSRHSDFIWVDDFEFDPARYRAEFGPDIAKAREAGRVPVVSSERLSGNPHSGGYDSRRLADRLRAVFPDARILIVIREQRGMILSSYGQYVRAGGVCSLRDYLRGPGDFRLPWFRLSYFRYDRLIRHYQSLFGREQVLVEAYERFREDPEAYVRRICDFCGVVLKEELPYRQVKNPGLGPLALGLQRRLNPFVVRDSLNGNSALAMPLLRGPSRALLRGLDRLSPRALNERLRAGWERCVAEAAEGYYEESNRRTEEATGLELARLGYAV